MATNDEFTDHTGNTQQQHTPHIDDDKYSTAILASHIGKTPHVSQTYCRACRSQYHTQLAAEIISFVHIICHSACKSIKYFLLLQQKRRKDALFHSICKEISFFATLHPPYVGALADSFFS
jgi:hypothetical protein